MSRQGATKLARALDPNQQQSINIALNVQQVEIVNRLYESGLWGGTPSETVRRLFDRACMEHVEKK